MPYLVCIFLRMQLQPPRTSLVAAISWETDSLFQETLETEPDPGGSQITPVFPRPLTPEFSSGQGVSLLKRCFWWPSIEGTSRGLGHPAQFSLLFSMASVCMVSPAISSRIVGPRSPPGFGGHYVRHWERLSLSSAYHPRPMGKRSGPVNIWSPP